MDSTGQDFLKKVVCWRQTHDDDHGCDDDGDADDNNDNNEDQGVFLMMDYINMKLRLSCTVFIDLSVCSRS